MPKSKIDIGLSELEREFELQMDDNQELGDEQEFAYEGMDDFTGEVAEDEFEESYDETNRYASRFYELSQREFESESDLDNEINGLVNEMERDYFFGGIWKKLKKAGKGLVKKGLKFATSQIPAFKVFQAISQLTRGNLKGLLASIAKAGLTSAIPGLGAAGPVLSSLGFEASEDQESGREAWNNFVEVSREAFDDLAQNLNENADEPLEASRLATNAFQTAIKRVQSRIPNQRSSSASYGGRSLRGRRVVYLNPGESLVVRRR